MAGLSKFLKKSVPYNCYEIGHTWSPHCTEGAMNLGRPVFTETFKFYSAMYLALQIIGKKFSFKDFLDTVYSILASSCTFSFNIFAFARCCCLFRKWQGRLYYSSCVAAAFLASFVSVFIERKQRRGLLALNCLNLASEILFRMLVDRGLVTPLPNSEVFLFATAISLYCYIIRKHGFRNEVASSMIKYLVGAEEANCKVAKCIEKKGAQDISGTLNQADKRPSSTLEEGFPLIVWHRLRKKHSSCPHKFGCIVYSLQGFIKPFAVGWLISLGIQCLHILRNLMRPQTVSIRHSLNLNECIKFGFFLGGFGWTFRAINCICRWVFGKDQAEYALPAAFLGGLFMKFSPNVSLAVYFMWKTIISLSHIGIEMNVIPKIPGFHVLLYAVSATVIFHAAVAEPHNIKPTVWSVILYITHNRLALLNRRILDHFGTHASNLYPDFLPELDQRYVSKTYLETVLL